MEEKSRRNTTTLVILEIVLVISTLGLIGINQILDDKVLNKDHKYQEVIDKYNQNEELISKKEEEIKALQEKIDNNKDIDYYKEEYFKVVKQIEDDIKSGKSNKKIAYMTFDDGPYYNTYKVLDILDKYNAKATFFTTTVNGSNCYDKKSYNCFLLYQEYATRGHTIANHTYTHAIRKGLYASVDSFISAVKKQEEQVKKYANGYVTNIVRFPGGSGSSGKLKSSITKKLSEIGYGWVDWNGYDGDGGILKSKEQARKNFYGSINEKIEVILFHDYSSYTTSLLPEFIEYLQGKGYLLLPLFYDSCMIKK